MSWSRNHSRDTVRDHSRSPLRDTDDRAQTNMDTQMSSKKKKMKDKKKEADQEKQKQMPGAGSLSSSHEPEIKKTRTESTVPTAQQTNLAPTSVVDLTQSGVEGSQASFRDRLGRAQLDYLAAVTPCGTLLSPEQLSALAQSVQNLTNISIEILERNAYLQGRLDEQALHPNQTYAEATKGLTTTKPKETEEQTQMDTVTQETPSEKVALLVFPKHPTRGQEFSQVISTLQSAVLPGEIGLTAPEFRSIKGGALVLSTSREGIARLEKTINSHIKLKDKLQAKQPFRRNPQIKLRGLLKCDDQDLKQKILQQNEVVGTADDIQIIRRFEGKDGLCTVIIEVTPAIFGQIKARSRVFVDWSSNPVEENLHVLFCKRCCRYGHLASRCTSTPRCTECGGDHLNSDCEGEKHHCLSCAGSTIQSKRNHAHSAMWSGCPILKAQIERLKSKINYN